MSTVAGPDPEARSRRALLNLLEDQRAVQAALSENEQQLRFVIDHVPVLIAHIDGNLRYRLVNQPYADAFDLSCVELVGRPVREVIGETLYVKHLSDMKAALSGESVEFAQEKIGNWSESRHALVKYQPERDAAGQIIGFLVAVVDVTERNRAEEEVRRLNSELEDRVKRRTTELHHANQELQAYSYSVSHDLRAPLRAIVGFSQILQSRHSESLNAEGRHYLDNVVEAGLQMGRLIEDLLQYSHMGHSAADLRPLSPHDTLGHILAQLKSRIAELGAEIVVDPMPRVMAQPTLLAQVFSNLLGNALTYTRTGVVPRIQVRSRPAPDDQLQISVSDNGLGIPRELQEKVFEVFQRLHSQEKYPGTGIGLAIVRKAIALMGGSICLDSEPGVGSSFSFTLTLSKE